MERRQSFFCAEVGVGADLLASDATFSLMVDLSQGLQRKCEEKRNKKKGSINTKEKKKHTRMVTSREQLSE